MNETWAKLLFTYGPFGLIVLFIFVLEVKARAQMKDTGAKSARVVIYVLTWMSIFALGTVVVVAWMKMNLVNEASIRGHLTGLSVSDSIETPFEHMYLRRAYSDSSHTRYDFDWMIVTPRKLENQFPIKIYLDQSTADHEDLTIYELPISPDFYQPGREIDLRYDRSHRALSLRDASGRAIPLKVASDSLQGQAQNDRPSFFRAGFITKVLAQSRPDLRSLSNRLEADDSIIRTQARVDLASMGPSAASFMETTLSNPGSSYRLKLGVISALNAMSQRNINVALSPVAVCGIARAAGDADLALRSQASTYLRTHPQPICRNSISSVRMIRRR
jgi:hypothetical protein